MEGLLSNKIGRDELKPGDHIYSWRHSYLYAHHVIPLSCYRKCKGTKLHNYLNQCISTSMILCPREACQCTHQGIYLRDGKVIHFTRGAGHEIGTGTVLDRFLFSSSQSNPSDTTCPACGDQSKKDGVISSCLECFLSDGDLYRFQYGVSTAIFLAKARGGTCTVAPSDPTDDVIHRAEYLLQNGFGCYNLFNNNCEDFAIYCKTGLLVSKLGWSGQAASFLAAAIVMVPSPVRFLASSFVGVATVGCGIYCISRFFLDVGMRPGLKKIPVEMLISVTDGDEVETATETPKKE